VQPLPGKRLEVKVKSVGTNEISLRDSGKRVSQNNSGIKSASHFLLRNRLDMERDWD
jgi:hypothetical protein